MICLNHQRQFSQQTFLFLMTMKPLLQSHQGQILMCRVRPSPNPLIGHSYSYSNQLQSTQNSNDCTAWAPKISFLMTISKWADYKSSTALSMPFVLNHFLCLPHNVKTLERYAWAGNSKICVWQLQDIVNHRDGVKMCVCEKDWNRQIEGEGGAAGI